MNQRVKSLIVKATYLIAWIAGAFTVYDPTLIDTAVQSGEVGFVPVFEYIRYTYPVLLILIFCFPVCTTKAEFEKTLDQYGRVLAVISFAFLAPASFVGIFGFIISPILFLNWLFVIKLGVDGFTVLLGSVILTVVSIYVAASIINKR